MLVNILPLSTIDYPGKNAAVLYFSGCNFQCNFCQNIKSSKGDIVTHTTTKEVLQYLRKNKGRVSAVCFTGGEALLSKEVPMLIKAIKSMGYLIKMDTNGSNLKALKAVAPYLDYIAIDIKAAPDDYEKFTKHQGAWAKVRETLSWVVKSSGIAHEFRTTVLPEWHDWANLRLISDVVGRSPWYLQQYQGLQESVLNGRLYEKYTDKELAELAKALKCQVRYFDGKVGALYEIVAP